MNDDRVVDLAQRRKKPVPSKAVGVSQDALASIFEATFGEQFRYDRNAGSWHRFEGHVWRGDRDHVAAEYMRELARQGAEGAKSNLSAGFIFGARSLAQNALSIARVEWDSDGMLLNTPDGVVDLRSGKRRDGKPDDLLTKSASVSPAQGRPTRWLQFLEEATLNDFELIQYLKRACGYMLTGDVREHALFFIYGPGGNGKSVFINVIRHILADYAAVSDMETFTEQKHSGHSTNVAMLAGSRAVFASETEEGKAWAEARIKALTGGDPITARFMRQDNFTFAPSFKVCIVGNHAPVLKTVDDAMRRRFNIIPFTNKPAKPDPLLEAKIIQDEAGQVLSWMIEGALEWLAGGLKRPERVRAATEEYLTGQDILAEWMESELRVERDNDHLFTSSADLFKSWSKYATERNENVGTAKAMGMKLLSLGFTAGRKNAFGRGFHGLMVNKRMGYDHDA